MPFMILNMIGGVIALIWLVILGQWATIFLGVAILLAGALIVSLLLLPAIGLAAVGLAALNRGNKWAGWFSLLLACPWTYIVIIIWEVAVFIVFEVRSTSENGIPARLWSYAVATGVWSYLASREWRGGDGDGAAAAVFGAQVAYIVFAICLFWLRIPLVHGIVVMAVPLLLPLAFSLLVIAASSGRFQVGSTNSIGAVNSIRSPGNSAGTRG